MHEYVTGGGWPEPEPPPSLAAEAEAMLRAVLDDLRSWGRFSVITTRDRRIERPPLPAELVVELDPGDYSGALLEAASRCEAALVVAPESGGALARVCTLLTDAGVPLLGSTPAAVVAAGDKWECHRRFAQAGLPTPETARVTRGDVAVAAARIGFPVVVKPIDGAGCDGVALVRSACDLPEALAQPAIARAGALLVQRYVAGDAASVSLLVAGGEARAVSLNEQEVRLGVPCAYVGGRAAVEHPRRREALALAVRAVELVQGLQGYVGVDLVLADDRIWLIEVNPRLTTSYIGLRRVVDYNLAEAVWRACIQHTLPSAVEAATSRRGTRGGVVVAYV